MDKFIKELYTDDYEVYTPSGWKNFGGVGKTHKLEEIILYFTDKTAFKCALDHYILTDFGFKPVKEIFVGDNVQSRKGIKTVESITFSNESKHMYDLLDVSKTMYFTDDIISHNSTTIASFVFHYAIFNDDKNIGIVSNKLSSAKDILKRIKIMYEECPPFLKPGVATYSKTEIEFENGSTIIVGATSPDALRGRSINILICLDRDTEIKVMDKVSKETKIMSLEQLFAELMTLQGE